MESQIQIGDQLIGKGKPCLIIAEIGQAHDGSLGSAHAYIDAVAKAGADAVKFQTHIASEESTPSEPWRVNFSYQDLTRYDYWKRMEFSEEQWFGLYDHARSAGLIFLSSPFSIAAVELLAKIKIPAWKISSGEVNNLPLLACVASTRKPVLLSTGMSDWGEIDEAIKFFHSQGVAYGVFQCTTSYPTPPESLGLNVIQELRERYHCPVGLSDHSGTIFSGLASVALGANMLEVHLTFSRKAFGPDVSSSITCEELEELIQGIRFIEKSIAIPVNKNQEAIEKADLRRMFGKSMVAVKQITVGTILSADLVTFKKPGGGISPSSMNDMIGRSLNKTVEIDQLIREEDLD